MVQQNFAAVVAGKRFVWRLKNSCFYSRRYLAKHNPKPANAVLAAFIVNSISELVSVLAYPSRNYLYAVKHFWLNTFQETLYYKWARLRLLWPLMEVPLRPRPQAVPPYVGPRFTGGRTRERGPIDRRESRCVHVAPKGTRVQTTLL